MALFGHGRLGRRCPLLGEERKSHFRVVRSAFDPHRTSGLITASRDVRPSGQTRYAGTRIVFENRMRHQCHLDCYQRAIRRMEAEMARAKSLQAIVLFFAIGVTAPAQAQQNNMSFFITSVGVGKGGDLGGLEGADLQCQSLAQAAGAGGKTWHAYLSTQGQAGVNAKDRIGNGPWFNAKGVQIASNIADLHNNNKINKETGLDERGMAVKGRGDTPNQHDMLSGTQQDGTAVPGSDDATCSNWTSSTDGGQGSA